ncbi:MULTISPECIES: sensor histidine kinase [unclassified Romboutsia]|uniref:sensor histidine kinase n=1 Tax=unclassified Romboutsia TaxID=2626894 RepID=UPI0008227DD8|nr:MULTISPECIES: HAMP domain-containing sensor histidine kinase [unclassified Romboutsia]SCI16499.1 Sensor protein srrB [uncultured Clostridium sp.]
MINKNVFEDTRRRLIKINLFVVGGFLLIFSTFIFFYFKERTYSDIDSKIKEELESITIQFNRSSFFNPIILEDPRNIVYVYENGKVRYYTDNGYFDNIYPEIEDEKQDTFFTWSNNGYTFRVLNLTVGKYTIEIIRNIDSEISSLKQLVLSLVIGILISLMVAYFIAIYLTRKALVPIETAWSTQAKFIQDASHELRTPIAIISSKLEGMLKNPNNTVSDEVETIADSMRETRRMKKMISDLLSLTKEDSIYKVTMEEADLEDIINKIYINYEEIAEMQDKEFTVKSELKNKIIHTDKNKLRQLILIFIENAFKYTNEGDSISIIVNEKESYISIFIKDTGIGIKQDELPYVFDRFFRSEIVRSKDIDGSGIGLSIAKMISINLKYDINVDSKQGEYTIFEIKIPKNR